MYLKFGRTVAFFLILVLGLSGYVIAQPLPIKVDGDVTEEGKPVTAVSIQVSCNGKINATALSDPKGEYSFHLPQGKDYYIIFTKDGYVAKRFTISTRNIPKELEANEFSTLTARVVLFKKLPGVDYSALDNPMVKYFFNPTKQEFDYDMGYLNQMLAKLESIKEAEQVIKNKNKNTEEMYTDALKAGDKALERKEYKEALEKYNEALSLKPKEIHPQTQIALVSKLINDEDIARRELAQKLAKEKAAADAAKAKENLDKEAKEKAEAEKLAKEKAVADAAKAKLEAERLAKEKLEADAKVKAEADKIAKEKAASDAAKIKEETARLEKEKAAAEAKLREEKLVKEKAEADAAKAETERLAKIESEKLSKEKAEQNAKAKLEAERLAKERAEADAIKAKAEAERLAKENAEKLAKEKVETDRIAKEKAELDAANAKAKLEEAKAKAEEDRLIKEFMEKEAKAKAEENRLTKEKEKAEALRLKAEEARIAKEVAEADKLAKEKAAIEAAKSKAEADRIAKEKAEADKLAKQKADEDSIKAKIEADRIAKEKAEAEAKSKAEADRKVKELAAAEALKAKIEADKIAKEKAEADAKAKIETERIAKEQAAVAAAKQKADADAKAKTLQEQESSNKNKQLQYKAAITKGDELFKFKKYSDAEGQYQVALTFKGGDEYAMARLMECEKLISSDANQKTDERQKQLLAKYPEGITEEIISGDGVLIVKRVLVKTHIAYIYEKKVFNWGGIACFRDGTPIPETVFEHDTKK